MENSANQEVAVPSFGIEKLYVRDLSIEVPNAPMVFLDATPPQVEIQLNTRATAVDDGVFEVVLTVTVKATLEEERTLFLVEVGQAGLFRLQNVPEEQVEPLLAVACPNILFPYAREVVSDSTVRAGFAPILLQPVNFEAMYMARLQEANEAAGNATVQ